MRDLYTAQEKTELLKKIADAGMNWYRTRDERETDIISSEFEPNGLLEKISYNESGGCSCVISQHGKVCLEKDIFGKTERMETLERKNKELEAQLVRLQYLSEKRARFEWWVRAILFTLGAILGLFSEFIL